MAVNKQSYDRMKVIEWAKGEVGYLEKKDGNTKYLFDKTKNAGYGNYTKYGYKLHKVYPSVMDYPAAWCGSFVSDGMYEKYGITAAKKMAHVDDYTVACASAYKKVGALDRDPEVGAQIFFSKKGTVGTIYHTGLVYKVDATYVYTYEGNTNAGSNVIPNGGGVYAKKYSRNTTAIKNAFFGHPAYNDGYGAADSTTDSAKTASKTKKGSTQVAKHFSKSVAGAYKVTASALRLRAGAGTDFAIIANMPHGSTVHCYGYYNVDNGVKWLYVAYGTIVGYCSSKYLDRI